jgi:hypothetical protein
VRSGYAATNKFIPPIRNLRIAIKLERPILLKVMLIDLYIATPSSYRSIPGYSKALIWQSFKLRGRCIEIKS